MTEIEDKLAEPALPRSHPEQSLPRPAPASDYGWLGGLAASRPP